MAAREEDCADLVNESGVGRFGRWVVPCPPERKSRKCRSLASLGMTNSGGESRLPGVFDLNPHPAQLPQAHALAGEER